MHFVLRGSALGGLLFLQACTARVEPARTERELPPAVVARRVMGTVRREASRVVRLESERETLLTTPEHPFAVPGSGWVSAGRLVPGNWVVSEKWGAVRLRSVRSEPVARPIPVFNLSVASSHAYFVGTEHVLVHNTKCRTAASEAREATIERLVRAREELNREIEALKQAAPGSPRIAELRLRRGRLQKRIGILRRAQRVGPPSHHVRSQRRYEAEREAIRDSLEGAEKEVAELEGREPSSEADPAAFAARRAELGRQISRLKLSLERANRIVSWLGELVDLEQGTPGTDADRLAREERTKELRANLELERARARRLKHARGKRAIPEAWAAKVEYDRKLRQRLRRTAAHLADRERPRDPQELLEDELGRLLRDPSSQHRDARVRHLTEQIDTMKKLVEVRRKQHRASHRRYHAQRKLEKALAGGRDTSELGRDLERATQEEHALRLERAQLRARERSLARVGGAASAAELASSSARLEQELREERAAVEVAASALANEQARIQATQAGSSRGPSWQERLRAIQEEQVQLRAQWRAGLEERLDSARRRLRVRQSVFALHDQAIEAELGREIALLERHLQDPVR